MHKDYDSFSMEIPVGDPEKMKKFQEVMDAMNDALVKDVERIASELDISISLAIDIHYLRTRSRWTQEKEDKIIELAHQGILPLGFSCLKGDDEKILDGDE